MNPPKKRPRSAAESGEERREKDDAAERFLAFSGYAGWAAGQLDEELARGGWRVAEADADLVFEYDAPDMWPELIRRTTGTWVQLAPARLARTGYSRWDSGSGRAGEPPGQVRPGSSVKPNDTRL